MQAAGTTSNQPLAMKLLLFDLDNTLIARDQAFLRRLTAWMQTEAGELTPWEQSRLVHQLAILDAGGRTERRSFYRQASTLLCLATTQQSALIRELRALASDIRPNPAINAMLARLAGQYTLGIISNGSGKIQRKKIRQAALGSYFSYCLLSGEVGYGKPSLRMFTTALTACGCAPCEAMMIGDDLDKDILPARALGMRTALVQSQLRPDHNPADLCLHHLTELEPQLACLR